MTLLIDGYTITGTPEEISTFIKIYKQKDTNINIGCPPYTGNPYAQPTLWYTTKLTEDGGTNTTITTETL